MTLKQVWHESSGMLDKWYIQAWQIFGTGNFPLLVCNFSFNSLFFVVFGRRAGNFDLLYCFIHYFEIREIFCSSSLPLHFALHTDESAFTLSLVLMPLFQYQITEPWELRNEAKLRYPVEKSKLTKLKTTQKENKGQGEANRKQTALMVMILIEAAKQPFKFKQLSFHWVLRVCSNEGWN